MLKIDHSAIVCCSRRCSPITSLRLPDDGEDDLGVVLDMLHSKKKLNI